MCCGRCDACRRGRENLCPQARFTGWQLPGGYAQQVLADARFVLRLPRGYSDAQAAPLLCAGLIGYRAYTMAGDDVRDLGLYGFGAAAHLLAQVALRAVRPGGTVVCAGIHMSDIPAFPYAWLWGERRLLSVAHLTHRDGEAFMRLAGSLALEVQAREYPLAEANRALDDLRAGAYAGAGVLRCRAADPLPLGRRSDRA
jgi:propanol-preferring alcohol dehydrogenase